MTTQNWESQARALVGQEFPPVLACDPVNTPMIRHWCEAMSHPFDWTDALDAPATMLQSWLFPGPTRERPPGSAREDATSVLALFAQGGYTGVVTVGTEMEFLRPLHPGDEIHYTSSLESIGEEKATALGVGHFLRFLFTVRDARDQAVGTIRFTNLAYRPKK